MRLPLVRRLAAALAAITTVVVAQAAGAADQVEFFDQAGRRAGQTTLTPGANHIDLLDARSNRFGYGVKRQDGSWDLYTKDGSRVGTIQAPAGRGYPPRVILDFPRRTRR
jgi:hypothetical protein